MMKQILAPLILAAALAPPIVLGGLIGEPAPALIVKEWIKGHPVDLKPGTNIYVVEIWQSSIPACRAVITNLNEIQARFASKGVVVVGVCDEATNKIREFMQHGEGANITYTVVADDRRKTALSYMTPAKQRGIPYAFVIGTNGTVLWHGPPQAGLSQALAGITTGQYDPEPFRKREVAAHQMEQFLGLAQRADFRAKSVGQALLVSRTNDVELLCDMAFQITTAPRLKDRDFALAGEALDQAEKLSLTNKAPVMRLRTVWLMERYLDLAQRGGANAQKAGKELLANRANDVQSLCDLAYRITTDPLLKHRDLALAGEALDQAEKLSVTNKALVMINRAVWLFESGKPDAGMALAKEARAVAPSPKAKADVEDFLKVMEARLAKAQTNQVNTNQVQIAPASGSASVVNTNQIKAPPGKP